jgi:hypothetical protein
MGKKPENGKGPEIDEHDLPTEPVPYPFVAAQPGTNTIPATPQQPITLGPFPQSQSYAAPPNAPKFDVYPYLPPVAPQQPQSAPQQPIDARRSPVQQSSRSFYPGFIPVGVGLFFICIQMLLLLRFVLRLLDIAQGTDWVNTIYALCDIALLPFQALLPPLQLPAILNARVEPYTLLAIFIYGMLSRILVHILKVLLRTSQPKVAQSARQP